MGREKYQRRIEDLFKKSPVVSYSSIERIINVRKKKNQYAKQLIKNLLDNGKIKRLTKGIYTSRNESSLAVYGFKPSYLGLQDALSLHNVWEQETIPVIITTRKVRPGIRKVMGGNALVRRIANKYFFGFEYRMVGELYLPYSDIEKTFIDMVYFKERINQDILKILKKRIDIKRLKSYLRKYHKNIQNNVLRKLKL